MISHLRVFHPFENIYAFYDGRIEGYRFAPDDNWVDDGALSLGIASYPTEAQTKESLIRLADKRMYEDKIERKAGR